MDDVASSTEWETEWLSLDREQLVEFIRSSELTVKDEWDLWQVGHVLHRIVCRSVATGVARSVVCLSVCWSHRCAMQKNG